MATEREGVASRLLAQKVVKNLVDREHGEAVAAAKAGEFQRVGVVEVGTIGDDPIGKVSLVKGASSWRVDDPALFLAWVKGAAPSEVVVTESVRSSYQKAVLDAAKKGGTVVDVNGEEVPAVDIPGLAYRQADPSLRVVPSDDAEALVLAFLGADVVAQLGMGDGDGIVDAIVVEPVAAVPAAPPGQCAEVSPAHLVGPYRCEREEGHTHVARDPLTWDHCAALGNGREVHWTAQAAWVTTPEPVWDDA